MSVTVAYAGRRLTESGKLMHLYLPEGELGDESGGHGFRRPLISRYVAVGTRLDLEEIEPGRFRALEARERIEDAPMLAAWRAADAAAVIGAERLAVEKAARKADRDLGSMTLDELAAMSSSWLPDRRTALVAAVLARLQRGIR